MNPKKGGLMALLSLQDIFFASLGGLLVVLIWNVCKRLWNVCKRLTKRREASRSESVAEGEQASDAHKKVINPSKSHPMCLAVGHAWDSKVEWVIYTVPASEIAWQAGIRPEYKRDQHCTRKGCCGYRTQIKREGERVRSIHIA